MSKNKKAKPEEIKRIDESINNLLPEIAGEDEAMSETGKALASALQWSKKILYSQQLHQKGNTCFDLSKVVLGLYRDIRYHNMTALLEGSLDRMKAMDIIDADAGIDSADFKLHMCCGDNFSGRINLLDSMLKSSNGENLLLLILLTESALEVLKEHDRTSFDILYARYIRRGTEGVSDKNLEQYLEINHKTYVERRDKAITEFSKAFWGSLGERLKGTYFSNAEDWGIDLWSLVMEAKKRCSEGQE